MSKPVQAYIWEQEGRLKERLQLLHDWLMEQRGMEAKIRYRIPFYYQKSWICYLNPVKPDKVELAFLRANEFTDPTGLLDLRDRKQVAGIILEGPASWPLEAMQEVLEVAIQLDATVRYASKRK